LTSGSKGALCEFQRRIVFRWVQSAAESVTCLLWPLSRAATLDFASLLSKERGCPQRYGRLAIAAEDSPLHVGNETSVSELASDWMLTHEMVHLAFPTVDDSHHWIEEGLAHYVEPIARIQAGHLKVEQMWIDLVRDMPQGLPQAGDRGLDHTHTWGRTYWGGALFVSWLTLRFRRQTNNAKGLEHALRGILDAGGDIRREWSLEDALTAGDRAVGVSVSSTAVRKNEGQAR